MSKRYWNYRVVKQVHDGETTYGIHEVYYEDDKPVSLTDRAVILAEDIKGLEWVLTKMKEAVGKKPLNEDLVELDTA